MNTRIHPTTSETFRKPLYQSQEQDGAMHLTVYIPGVEASGVSIEARGPDLWVTARKARFVRVNWQALHLEGSQRDYRLSLRLGRGYAYEAMEANIANGVLTIVLPRREGAGERVPAIAAPLPALRRV